LVAGDGKAPAAYFGSLTKATFLNRRFYIIFTEPLTSEGILSNTSKINDINFTLSSQ
jgi:hypothetical protein